MATTLEALTAQARIIHKRGDDFVRTFTIQNSAGAAINFGAGATARMVFKAEYDDANGSGVVLLEWTTASEITLTPASGIIAIDGPKADMNPTWTKAVYDLEVTFDSGRDVTYMSGTFELLPQVA
jgi:hypothetical protein